MSGIWLCILDPTSTFLHNSGPSILPWADWKKRGHQESQLLLLGNYSLPPSPHLGRESRAPGWVRLLTGRDQHDRVLCHLCRSTCNGEDGGPQGTLDNKGPRLQGCAGEAKVPHHCFKQFQCPCPTKNGNKHYIGLLWWLGFCTPP
jgi:hypothetical protein